MKCRAAILGGLALSWGCATVRPGQTAVLSAADSSASGDSSQGDSSKFGASSNNSNNSSQGSGNSSQNSTGNSNNSSNQSAHSSDSSKDSGQPSRSSDHSSDPGGSSDSRPSSQHSAHASANTFAIISGSALLLSTTVGVGFAIFATVRGAQDRARKEHAKAALAYLKANTDQLRQDLALGAGPTVNDLAEAARIRRTNLLPFQKLLHANRRELLELAAPGELNADRALRFLSRIGELTVADAMLQPDAEAFALTIN